MNPPSSIFVCRFLPLEALLAALSAADAATADPLTSAVRPPSQERLVAIDVQLESDRKMVAAAEQWNVRLREQMPEGFALDAAHRPHITLLQQYVSEKDLPAMTSAVSALAARWRTHNALIQRRVAASLRVARKLSGRLS